MSDASKREEIDKALRCLYIAVDECVARDVGKIFLAYAEDVEARLAEVERERDGVAEKLAELLDAFHDWKAGAPEMLLHSDKGQRVTTAYTKAILALAALPAPTKEPPE